MSDTAESFEPFRVEVGKDGRIVVPADEVARHGLRPGSRLNLVPQPHKTWVEISEANAAWQRENNIPEISEEEAERLAVEASREIRRRLSEENR